jgi:hypothetical protein
VLNAVGFPLEQETLVCVHGRVSVDILRPVLDTLLYSEEYNHHVEDTD